MPGNHFRTSTPSVHRTATTQAPDRVHNMRQRMLVIDRSLALRQPNKRTKFKGLSLASLVFD